MTHPYPPVPPPGPGPRAVPRWARKRIVLPAIGLAFIVGGAFGAVGDDGTDTGSTKVAADRPRPTATITTTATATATRTAEPEAAPTVTATKTVKVTVTPKPAAGSGSGSSGGGGSESGAGSCSIVSSAGNCYSAGQFCRNSDHGSSTTTASGAAITCRYSSNAWRWSYS
ncbi:hypothetical protein [Streptomyces longispororuber]|uniref:hypothetical protein n=1 Tax=Streptomyces longispororuber TaxID=68230 RepID=UPI00210860A8|nr:hypothetical protein [Streptomyces longispororuber]MCQ4208673.1 hypothetical protein [Streptomyces longispororuber]